MSTNIFTYGSLMFADVWKPLVVGRYRSEPATLLDYRRFSVPGVSYPGIIAAPGQRVAGLLYLDVAAEDVTRLDAFEGIEYRRDALGVELADGRMVSAGTYVWLDHGRLSDRPWLAEAFRLREFIETYAPASGRQGG